VSEAQKAEIHEVDFSSLARVDPRARSDDAHPNPRLETCDEITGAQKTCAKSC